MLDAFVAVILPSIPQKGYLVQFLVAFTKHLVRVVQWEGIVLF
jgi:hypothetical protein